MYGKQDSSPDLPYIHDPYIQTYICPGRTGHEQSWRYRTDPYTCTYPREAPARAIYERFGEILGNEREERIILADPKGRPGWMIRDLP
jgi:hypothetical protein